MNGVCGLEITPECEERPCLGCELFQRFRLSDLTSLATMEAPEDWPWTEEDWQAELDNRIPETTF